jgi:hypothetical protein
MIFRRRHTANFTTIGNALFEDERLAADELGILAWLLSRPDDWEVRRPALMRRHKVGRDGLKRIITNWMRLGWCQAKKTRLANGTFHIIYEIRDEPGPELTDEEIRGALSLVSSEAADGGSSDDDEAGQLRETSDPPTPQPGVDDQGVAGRNRTIEESLNPESLNPESHKHVRAFLDVKAAWPSEHVLSTVTAERSFLALRDADKNPCFDGIKLYLSDCSSQGRKICDLRTYIDEKRWERFKAKDSSSKPFALRPGIPQTYRWREYLERAKPSELWMFDKMLSERGTYTVPSEWPPPLPPKQTTGPPQELSDEDAEAFVNSETARGS